MWYHKCDGEFPKQLKINWETTLPRGQSNHIRISHMQHKKPKWIQLHSYDLFHYYCIIQYDVHIFALIINSNFTLSTNFFLVTNCTGIRSKQNGFRWTEAKYFVKENHQIENQYHLTFCLRKYGSSSWEASCPLWFHRINF